MANQRPVTQSEARQLAIEWYALMDAHADAESFIPLIDKNHIRIEHPGATLEGWGGFTTWYAGVTTAAFNQSHEIKSVEIVDNGSTQTATVVSRWQARLWRPPAADSEGIDAIAVHDLQLSRASDSGEAIISGYMMKAVEYAPDSARLEAKPAGGQASGRPITEAEVAELATRWYANLDAHAPISEYEDLLAHDDLEMHYPEGVFRGFDGFVRWYDRVLQLFFDEKHTLKTVKIKQTGDPADATVVVNWHGSFWQKPAAQSERIMLDSYHTWTVRRSARTGKPVIQNYVVEKLEYADGSARLSSDGSQVPSEAATAQQTAETRDVIDRYYKASEAHDRDTWYSLFSPKLIVDEQILGHIEGLDNLQASMKKLDGAYERFQNAPKHTVVDGGQACVISHISALTTDGVAIECGVSNYFRVEGGEIVYMANYHDTVPFASIIEMLQ